MSEALVHDLAMAQTFLDGLDPFGVFVFQTFDDSPAKRPDLVRVLAGGLRDHATALVGLNSRGAGIFVTINQTSGARRKAEDVTACRACFIDVDWKDGQEYQGSPIDPTMIVDSGHGTHVYWCLSDGDQAVERFTDAQRHLIAYYHSDPKPQDLPRVMRLPGFWNVKDIQEPKAVILKSSQPLHRYPLDQVIQAHPIAAATAIVGTTLPAAVPPAPATTPARAPAQTEAALFHRWCLAADTQDGQRNNRAFHLACEGLGRGVAAETVLAEVLAYAQRSGISENEALQIFKSAASKPREAHTPPQLRLMPSRFPATAGAGDDEPIVIVDEAAEVPPHLARLEGATADLEAAIADLRHDRDPKALFDGRLVSALGVLSVHDAPAAGAATVRIRELGIKANLQDWNHAIKQAKAIEYGLYAQEERDRATAAIAAANAAASRGEGRPVIRVDDCELKDQVDIAVQSLLCANNPPQYFRRGTRLAHLTGQALQDPASSSCQERPVIQEFSVPSLQLEISRNADVVTVNRHGSTHVNPPLDLVRAVSCLRENPFPQLNGIIERPVMRAGGEILDQPGYDPATGLFLSLQPGETFPPIPLEPTVDEVDEAKAILCRPFSEFTWADSSGLAHTLAAIFTIALRPMIRGPVPMGIVTSPAYGSGKGLLLDLVCTIATGRPAVASAPPPTDEEWPKTIVAMLSMGASTIVFDNCKRVLSNEALAHALTAWPLMEARPFGQNTSVNRIPITCAWFATGNNLRASADLVRRCYRIAILPSPNRPNRPAEAVFQRSEHDLRSDTDRRSCELLRAALTIARAWHVSGQPTPADLVRLGSFGEWCRIVGGVIDFMGISGFLDNRESGYELDDDSITDSWLCLVGQATSHTPFIVAKLDIHANGLEDEPPEQIGIYFDRGEQSTRLAVGRLLRQWEGRTLSTGGVVRKAGRDAHGKQVLWQIGAPVGHGTCGYPPGIPATQDATDET